jgi:diguanylate cyclase (GGDEF)-like protein
MSSEGAPYDALVQFLYQAPIGLLQASMDGTITMANPMAVQLLMPLATDGALDNLFELLQHAAPQLREQAAATAASDTVTGEPLRVTVQAGPHRQVLAMRLVRLDGSTLMASVSDITASVQQQQRQLAARLRDAARTDPLTALPNRVAAMESLTALLGRPAGDHTPPFAVLFINGDRFNRVNTTFGQAVGDEVLRLMAHRLTRAVRGGDADGRGPLTIARLGGDEFLVLLEGLRHADDVHGVAQRLADTLAMPYGVGDRQVHLSASLGVVPGALASGDAEAVLQDASIAMREAQRAGGGRHVVFVPAMRERAARLGSLENELRRALAEGELFVVYQPIVSLDGQADGAGVEALVRWRHPTRGLVPPVEFIGVAEETGLIDALGAFVLDEACRQFMHWRSELGDRAPLTMSVNMSRAQLARPALADEVRQSLERSGMPATALQLEITESLAAQDDAVKARLHELKSLGLRLALDDFGTGYSSLACLHLLPVDVVKIDRSFVSQVESSLHHRVLVEATILVARSLGMLTVAEGVETSGQAAVLGRLLCDKGQGYLFARPLAADDATRWLQQHAGNGNAVERVA